MEMWIKIILLGLKIKLFVSAWIFGYLRRCTISIAFVYCLLMKLAIDKQIEIHYSKYSYYKLIKVIIYFQLRFIY